MRDDILRKVTEVFVKNFPEHAADIQNGTSFYGIGIDVAEYGVGALVEFILDLEEMFGMHLDEVEEKIYNGGKGNIASVTAVMEELLRPVAVPAALPERRRAYHTLPRLSLLGGHDPRVRRTCHAGPKPTP